MWNLSWSETIIKYINIESISSLKWMKEEIEITKIVIIINYIYYNSKLDLLLTQNWIILLWSLIYISIILHKLYIDGVLKNSKTQTGLVASNTNPVVLGNQFGFSECESLVEVRLFKLLKIGVCSFHQCTSLKRFIAPNLTEIRSSSFAYCFNLELLSCPKLQICG